MRLQTGSNLRFSELLVSKALQLGDIRLATWGATKVSPYVGQRLTGRDGKEFK